mgnify:CR=1 FL=1
MKKILRVIIDFSPYIILGTFLGILGAMPGAILMYFIYN